MKTLLLRLEGPMQAWGITSRFTERDTGLEPSKSGVIGLLCAALGKPRVELPEHEGRWPRLEELARLRMGVRVDRPGQVGVDFQTAGGGRLGRMVPRDYGVAKADGARGESVMSWRYYLQDAAFVVGLASDDSALLERLQAALMAPVWPIFLGRKSYVPSQPVFFPEGGIVEGDLVSVLRTYPLLERATGPVRLIVDDLEGLGGEVRADLPLDFGRRRFGLRPVRVEHWEGPVEGEEES